MRYALKLATMRCALSKHVSVAQAEDRAHRIGQKRDVLVLVLLSAGTIEAAILDRARQKLDIDAKVIQVGIFVPASSQKWRKLKHQSVHIGRAQQKLDIDAVPT